MHDLFLMVEKNSFWPKKALSGRGDKQFCSARELFIIN